MIRLDAYNFSFILMNLWRDKAMNNSGVPGKLNEVPVYVELNNELVRIVDIQEIDDKIILIKETDAK
jgi:hypothetical protein